ncbi:MAG: LamG domain-containing protein, partial [Myxococcales bacterium]|nr:LamG domain-containing protein [Myxococcales bacterium]
RSLALGSVLEIDNQRVVISEHVARGATTIPVTAMTLEKILASGASVRWLPYDYAGRAKVHNLGYALVGELASTHEQSISSLSLAEGALVDVDAGSCLIVDGVRLLVNADASTNATSLSLDSISLPHSLGERAKVYAVTAAHGPETRSLSHDLRHGSLHARARASGQGATVADGPAARTLRSLPCRWVANIPGHALQFDGVDDYVGTLDAATVTKFAEAGPLTLEAWVEPGLVDARAQLVHHRHANEGYTLGIRAHEHGFDFGGDPGKRIALHHSYTAPITAITVQAWVKIDDLVNESMIVSFDRSEYWRLAVGDGNAAPGRVLWATTGIQGHTDDMLGNRVIAGDGQWHFISVSYDTSSCQKRIYVDGELDAVVQAPHDANPLGTSVTRFGFIGAGSEATVFNGVSHDSCHGAIADVRIWNGARTEEEVREDMHVRPSGNEPGLAHYWRFDDLSGGPGTSVPDLGGGANGEIVGQLGTAPRRLTAHAQVVRARGERFVETVTHFIGDRWTHLAAVYRPAYGLDFADPNGAWLESQTSEHLDLTESMTIELWFSLGAGGGIRGLVSKGRFKRDGNIPYALWVNADN